MVEEPMKLSCPWNRCKSFHSDYRDFIDHLIVHIQKAEINDDGSKYSSASSEAV